MITIKTVIVRIEQGRFSPSLPCYYSYLFIDLGLVGPHLTCAEAELYSAGSLPCSTKKATKMPPFGSSKTWLIITLLNAI